MLGLIYKDLITMKKTIICIFFPIISLITIPICISECEGFKKNLGYIIMVIMIVNFMFSLMDSYKDIEEAIIINSLPIYKQDIVKTKYIMLFIYMFIISMILLIETLIITTFTKGQIYNLWNSGIALTFLLIYFSIYIPFSTKNPKLVRTVNTFIGVFMWMLPMAIVKFAKTDIGAKVVNWLIQINNIYLIQTIFIFLGMLFYYISFNISLKIYINREF